jgi:predicted alpha/beta-fold hydrolase
VNALQPFEPLPFLGQAHVQTLLGSLTRPRREPPSIARRVVLPDGDRVVLEVSTPPTWRDDQPTVVLVHGLAGSHRSAYMIRLASKLYARGVRAIRMNLRGCGSGIGLARKPYHAGCSDDVWAVLEELHAETPRSAFTLGGFSLGANIVLKLAGERGDDARRLLRQVIAFCPPVDLLAGSRRLSRRRNVLVERFFILLLRADVKRRLAQFPDFDQPGVPETWSLAEFDDLYTAPVFGYRDAVDYYTQCSAKWVMKDVRVPTRIALSRNDPVVEIDSLDDVALPPCVELWKADGGGHLGFLARPRAGGVQWLDTQFLRWVEAGPAA